MKTALTQCTGSVWNCHLYDFYHRYFDWNFQKYISLLTTCRQSHIFFLLWDLLISILSADNISFILDQFHTEVTLLQLLGKILANGITCSKKKNTYLFKTLRLRQNEPNFPDGIFKWMFLIENVWISIKMPLKFVPKGPINNIPALVQVMAWGRPGDKPLSEPMLVNSLIHICVTWPQWVKDKGP